MVGHPPCARGDGVAVSRVPGDCGVLLQGGGVHQPPEAALPLPPWEGVHGPMLVIPWDLSALTSVDRVRRAPAELPFGFGTEFLCGLSSLSRLWRAYRESTLAVLTAAVMCGFFSLLPSIDFIGPPKESSLGLVDSTAGRSLRWWPLPCGWPCPPIGAPQVAPLTCVPLLSSLPLHSKVTSGSKALVHILGRRGGQGGEGLRRDSPHTP